MSGVQLNFRIDDAVVRSHLARLALLHASGFDNVRREIGEYFMAQVVDNITEQRLFDGSPMPPSKAAAGGQVRKKVKTGPNAGKIYTRTIKPRNTLLDKGHLRDSYSYNLTRDGVEIGSNLVYAAIHHFGGQAIAWGKHPFQMVARPVIGVTPEGEDRLGDFMVAEIRRAMR